MSDEQPTCDPVRFREYKARPGEYITGVVCAEVTVLEPEYDEFGVASCSIGWLQKLLAHKRKAAQVRRRKKQA